MTQHLYCDGGVIGHNPSRKGGTWAWKRIDDSDNSVQTNFGILRPDMMNLREITNNISEFYAVLNGLRYLPDDWRGIIYSDSQVTLGRIFKGWQMNNIPVKMQVQLKQEQERLVNWKKIAHVLLQGHPTKKELACGVGKNGCAVSEYQVWCDLKCQELSKSYE